MNRKPIFDAVRTMLGRGFTAAEQPTVDAMRRKAFVGTGAEVGAQLRTLAEELQLDEIVVNTWAHEPAARRTSYALLDREFGLFAA